MENATVIIFIKAPVPGQVKTRLIPELGEKGAADLSRAMAEDTLAEVQQVSSISVEIAYQAHAEFPNPSWLSGQVRWFPQEGNDLGQRLIHAINSSFPAPACPVGRVAAEESMPKPVVVIGSDLPALTASLLENAFARLRRASVVLGPAEDGGYYLIGLNRPMPWLFRGIAWSSSQVLEQTRRILERERLTAGFLPVERDLDTIEDLRAVEATAESLNHFPQTQSFLLRRRRGAPLGQV